MSAKPATITVLYPNVADATFNLPYYTSSHMPMVLATLKPYGMTGWRVQRVVSTPQGDAGNNDAPYTIHCALEFGSEADLRRGLAEHAGPILADVPNFSNKDPLFLIGEVVAESGGSA